MSEPTTIAVIPAVAVDAHVAPWAITDEDVFGTNAAIVRHDFPARIDADGTTYNRRVEYLLPRRAQPVDFDDHQATVNVDPAVTLRWSTFTDHVKADVVFTAKPVTLQLWFAVNWVGVTPLEDEGGVSLVDPITGEMVGQLPLPFLRDNTGAVHHLAWVLGDNCITVELPDLDDELWLGAVFDPTTIDTSTSAAPTAYPNQRKVARLSTTQLVIAFNNGTPEAEFWYSTDNGATWTQYTSGTSNIAGWANGSIACYVDSGATERLVAVWKQSGTGGSRTDQQTYLMVGAFNVGRTTLTWGTAIVVTSSTSRNYPDVVALAEGTGGQAFVATSAVSGSAAIVDMWASVINASGVPAAVTNPFESSDYGTGVHQFPSVDVDPATKRVFAAWSAGATGAGKGIRYRTAAYSAGTWTWGAEREIDNTRYVPNGDSFGITCRFDGTRAVMGGMFFDAGTNFDIVVWERDAADTTTTTRVVVDNATATAFVASPSLAVNTTSGDIYLIGRRDGPGGGTDRRLTYYKFTRASVTWSAVTDIENIGSAGTPYVSARADGARLDVLYTTATGSPYNVRFYTLTFNTAPNAATWTTTTGTYDVAATLPLAWVFNDPDAGDTQSAFALKRDIGGTIRWWNGSSFAATVETYNTSSTAALTLAIAWGSDSDADHNYYVITKDAAGVPATGYSAALVVTPSTKVAPTLDHPSAAEVVGSSSFDAQWTVAQQTTYRVKLYDATGVTTLWDSGVITDTSARRRTIGYVLANGTSYKLGLVTKNLEGLASDEVIHSFSVSYTAPHAATFTLTPVNDPGYVRVAITNPTPTGGQPAVSYNLIRRRAVGDTTTGGALVDSASVDVQVAANGHHDDFYLGHNEAVEYQVIVVGANGTTYTTAWQSS